MRFTGTCLCWSVALAAVFIPGTQASKTGSDSKDRGSKQSNNAIDGPQKVVAGQKVVGSRPTGTAIAVGSHPQITPGPAMIKRKLGSIHWDMIHDGIQAVKRDATVCGAGYQYCGKALNGGCCPNDRICGTSSCLPNTSTAPHSACGRDGYFACGIENSGGCCPDNYICGPNNCTPSPGATVTQTCNANYYACPASLGGGCCKSGFGCNPDGTCYNTTPSTFVMTQTLTTTNANAQSTTITTTITSVTVLGAPTTTLLIGDIIAKTSPSAVPIAKTEASEPSSTPSSGLSKPVLGGIIGGAVFLLIITLIAAFLIIRQLKKAEKASEKVNSKSASSQPRSGRSGNRPANIDVDALSDDPFLMSPSEVSGSIRGKSGLSSPQSTVYEVEGNSSQSPPVFTSPWPQVPPHARDKNGYNPVASSESQYSGSSGYRYPSIDSTPPLQYPNGGYFDIPLDPDRRVSDMSTPGRRPSHSRHWSNASDQSTISQTSSNPAELEAGKDSERKSSLPKSFFGMVSRKVSRSTHHRRRSDPVILTGGPNRADFSPGGVREALGHIPEAGESMVQVDMGLSNAQFRQSSLTKQQVDKREMRDIGRYA